MRHINSRQIDNHCWKFEVTDGYTVEWTASYSMGFLTIRQGSRDSGRGVGEAKVLARPSPLLSVNASS